MVSKDRRPVPGPDLRKITTGPAERDLKGLYAMTIKRMMSLLLTVLFLFSAVPAVSSAGNALPFRDVPENKWFYGAVKTVYEAGIMNGITKDKFCPNDPMTRGQFVTIIARLSGDDVDGMWGSATFSDTQKYRFYSDALGWCVENGIINGYPDGTFLPNKPILRQEFAAVFVRYLEYKNIDVKSDDIAAKFGDEAKFPKFAGAAIETLRLTGLVKGDKAGNFNPKNDMTRAEIAQVIARFLATEPADPMFEALETLTDLKCPTHRMVHYIAGKSAVEAERGDISPARIGAAFCKKMGLDPDVYEVKVTSSSNDALEGLNYNFFNSYDSEMIMLRLTVMNRVTGKVTGPKQVTIMLTFDYTKEYDEIGVCTGERPDEKMESVWSSLDGLYVFDDDGTVPVPYNNCASLGDLSQYFTRILLGLDDDHELGQDNGIYALELADGDMDRIGGLRDSGGAVTVTANLVNKKFGIRTGPKELTLSVMNRAQCEEKMNALTAQLTEQMAELCSLMDDCRRAGIPTDYEYTAFLVLGIFADEHIPDYIDMQEFSRELYVRRSTEKVYDTAKESLEKLLSGEKEPVNVPKYASGGIDVDGFTLRADTVDSYGNFEHRPVFFFGYGDGFEYPWTYVPYYADLGSNAFHYYTLNFGSVVRPATPSDTVGVSADGKYVVDTSGIERDLLYLSDLNDGRQAVSFMLVINAGSLIEIYPEVGPVGTEGGEVGINLHHPKGREAVEAFLRAVIPLVKKYPAVNSFVISNEPAFKPAEYGDWYVPMWVDFLTEKYGTVEKLNEVYGADYAALEDVPLAYREELMVRDNLSLDNQEFATKVHSEWHRWVAGIAHELAPDIPISTKLKSIEFDRSMQQYGLRPEDWSDFQDLGGCDDVREDVMYYDHIAYAEDAPVVDSEAHMYHDSRDTSFTYDMDMMVERNIWRGAMHHLGIGNFYSDDYWPGHLDHFTFGNSAYRPLARYKVGAMTMDLNRLSYEVDALVSKEPDIALLYSYPSRQFTLGDSTEATNSLYLAALRCGKTVRVISEEQIEKLENENIKILLIGDAVNVSEETLRAVDAFRSRGGKVFVVGRDSLTRDENNVPHASDLPRKIMASSTVYGFRSSIEEYRALLADFLNENGMQRVWIVDAGTGEPVGGRTEWMWAEYDGRIILTAYSLKNDGPMAVKVLLDGKPVVSSKELRSGEYCGETFELVKNEAVMLDLGAAGAPYSASPVSAGRTTENGFEYAVTNGEACIVRYNGGEIDVTVPDTLGGYPVTSLSGFAFTFSSPAVRSVTLPDSLTEIGDFAFYKCPSLEEVTLSPVKRIGKSAFCGCRALRSLELPDSVTEIDDRAFCRCAALESVTFSQNTRRIGTYAFLGCSSLRSLELPSSLRRLGAGSFWKCTSISGTVEIPWGVTEIPYEAFENCPSIETVIIPNSVIWIGERAFEGDSSVTSLELPNSLKTIAGNAFTGMSLSRIDIPYGVTKIGSVHFYWPTYLPPTVSNLPEYFEFTAGIELEEGSPYIAWCRIFGIDYTIVEREHHFHTPGDGPTCDAHQVCTECGAVIRPSYGHVWVARDRGDGVAEWYCAECGAVRD